MSVVYQESSPAFLKTPEEWIWYTFKKQREVGRGNQGMAIMPSIQ